MALTNGLKVFLFHPFYVSIILFHLRLCDGCSCITSLHIFTQTLLCLCILILMCVAKHLEKKHSSGMQLFKVFFFFAFFHHIFGWLFSPSLNRHVIWFWYFQSFRDLDARAKSERYRALFRLPKDEKLDGHTDCTLWTPFNKMHILGQMFVSTNYICFTSKEETLCSLIIPLREVGHSARVSI